MEILFLGTGNAFSSGGRNNMAILLRGRDLGLLLDCGPTTLAALKAASLAPAQVDAILLSHLHGDHFAGIPFLLCHDRYESPRTKPLSIYGPPGTVSAVETASNLFFPGMAPLPFAVEVTDLVAGKEITSGPLRFRAFEVDHDSRGTAFGYRLRLEGKTVVYSGDTAPTPSLWRESEGADLFVCECSSFEAPVGQHLRHQDLVENREGIRARRTVLVHAGEEVIARRNELLFELAHDGMRLNL